MVSDMKMPDSELRCWGWMLFGVVRRRPSGRRGGTAEEEGGHRLAQDSRST